MGNIALDWTGWTGRVRPIITKASDSQTAKLCCTPGEQGWAESRDNMSGPYTPLGSLSPEPEFFLPGPLWGCWFRAGTSFMLVRGTQGILGHGSSHPPLVQAQLPTPGAPLLFLSSPWIPVTHKGDLLDPTFFRDFPSGIASPPLIWVELCLSPGASIVRPWSPHLRLCPYLEIELLLIQC